MHSKRISRSQRTDRDVGQLDAASQPLIVEAEALRPFKKVERAIAGNERLQTSKAISERMGRVRRQGTKPELVVRKIAREAGLRYTTRNKDLPGSPDLANRRRHIAIFVHGCYWHRHPKCVKASTPKTNETFWENKFSQNVARDAAAVSALRSQGFKVVTIWECSTSDLDGLRSMIRRELASG